MAYEQTKKPNKIRHNEAFNKEEYQDELMNQYVFVSLCTKETKK